MVNVTHLVTQYTTFSPPLHFQISSAIEIYISREENYLHSLVHQHCDKLCYSAEHSCSTEYTWVHSETRMDWVDYIGNLQLLVAAVMRITRKLEQKYFTQITRPILQAITNLSQCGGPSWLSRCWTRFGNSIDRNAIIDPWLRLILVHNMVHTFTVSARVHRPAIECTHI